MEESFESLSSLLYITVKWLSVLLSWSINHEAQLYDYSSLKEGVTKYSYQMPIMFVTLSCFYTMFESTGLQRPHSLLPFMLRMTVDSNNKDLTIFIKIIISLSSKPDLIVPILSDISDPWECLIPTFLLYLEIPNLYAAYCEVRNLKLKLDGHP